MSSDNPFDPGAGFDDVRRNEDGTLDPVEMAPGPILQRCWDILVSNPGTVIGAVVISAVPSCGFNFLNQGLQAGADASTDSNPELAVGLLALLVGSILAAFVVNLFFQLGSIRIYTRLTRGLGAEIGMLFGEAASLLPATLMMILLVPAVMVGFILFVIPGIILSLGLQFALYAMVDQGLGPIEALQESWRLTEGHKGTVLVVNLVFFVGMMAFACVTCGLGIVVAAPVLALTQAVMYHALVHLQGPRTRVV